MPRTDKKHSKLDNFGDKLKPFEKGAPSPNPTGRPLGARESQIVAFRKFLERPRGVTSDGVVLDHKTVILKHQFDKAAEGDTNAAKFCMDYAGYKPTDKIELGEIIEDRPVITIAVEGFKGWGKKP